MGVAIRCDDVWKSYRIYQHRAHSLKERVVSRRNRYEEFWALEGISFEVPVGTTLGIIGSNGSGKSTLLKVIARILTPNRGSVHSNGTMSSLLELGTGFHPELTGRENVYLAGALLGQKEKEVSERYDGIVEFAGVADFMDVPVKNYSSGMYARLAFAVAISVEPDILLVDEVLAVGDESFQMRCHERIAEFHREGRTIVIVSHSLDAIRSLCTEAMWIDGGQLRSRGEATDVVAEYLDEVRQQGELVESEPGERHGSGEARVLDVTFMDGSGQRAGTFHTGEPMTIRVRYRADEPVEEATCILYVFRGDNHQQVYGHGTGDAGLSVTLEGEGFIDYTIPELPLLPGSFVVTASLEDRLGRRIYDYRDRTYSFLVVENPALPFGAGTVRIAGQWSVSPAEAPAGERTSPSAH